MARFSHWQRFGSGLALGFCLVPLAGSLTLAAGDPTKPATYAPGDVLLARLDARAAAFKREIAAGDVESVVEGVTRLDAAVKAGDLEGARAAWIAARVGWERSEIFTADLFPDLDKAIDTWPDATSGFLGRASCSWPAESASLWRRSYCRAPSSSATGRLNG